MPVEEEGVWLLGEGRKLGLIEGPGRAALRPVGFVMSGAAHSKILLLNEANSK